MERPPITINPEDVLTATKRLIREDSSRILFPQMLTRKLYGNTKLDVTRDESVGGNEILRKNLYFLARHTVDVVNLTIHCTQRGIFTLDEKDLIIENENALLIGIEFYSLLFREHIQSLPQILELMLNSRNSHIANMLQEAPDNCRTKDELKNTSQDAIIITERVRTKRSAPPPPPSGGWVNVSEIQPRPNPNLPSSSSGWTCQYCTFKNDLGTNICNICAKTKGTSPLSQDEVDEHAGRELIICDRCTLVNTGGSLACAACTSSLTRSAGAATCVSFPEDSEDSLASLENEEEWE